MSSIGTPMRSATICAKVVSCPCPCGDTPVITVTFPEISMRTQPHSQPPAGIAFDGPMAQISTYVDTPRPDSLPAARASARSFNS